MKCSVTTVAPSGASAVCGQQALAHVLLMGPGSFNGVPRTHPFACCDDHATYLTSRRSGNRAIATHPLVSPECDAEHAIWTFGGCVPEQVPAEITTKDGDL